MSDIVLITANVGSLFDENKVIRYQWKEQIVKKINELRPKFIALHFQETGGKEYKKYSKDVPVVINDLFNELKKIDFSLLRAYLDIEYEKVDEYTALGTVIIIHKDWINDVRQYDFKKNKFLSLDINEIIIEDKINNSSNARKEKFVKEFWPAIRWGRKGFLHTRWSVKSRILDLINIHLFHDESNLELTQNPLLYSENRKKALNYTINNYNTWKKDNSIDSNNNYLFIFGDFNFRLRTDSFLRKITKDQEIHEIEESSKTMEEPPNGLPKSMLNHHEPLKRNLSAIEFRQKENKLVDDPDIVLRIEKKRFDYYNPQYFITNWQQYREDDQETEGFNLKELPISFPPTYPWSEDPNSSNSYMKTRPPAWCDRVLINSNAYEIIKKDPNASYNCIGLHSCMGDHKPVILSFSYL